MNITKYIGCDTHKKFSVFVEWKAEGQGKSTQVMHEGGQMRDYLRSLPSPAAIALEAGGNYYWMVEEIEAAGHLPFLSHPLELRRRLGRNKTNEKDGAGMARLLHSGDLPTVWIPPAKLRDQREMLRVRLYFARLRASQKNRIHGNLHQYNLQIQSAQDVFSQTGRQELSQRLPELPTHTRASMAYQLELLDALEAIIVRVEQDLEKMLEQTAEAKLLDTLPGVGLILSMTIALEIGEVSRFPSAEKLAGYAGLVPSVHGTADHIRLGGVNPECNHHLKWAFVEAANVLAMQQSRRAGQHVTRLYRRIFRKKGYQKAVVAVGRHLAEAAYWVLTKREPYTDRGYRS